MFKYYDYGLIDNLNITRDGNQLKKVTDQCDELTYAGAMDFKDGVNEHVEYTWDANGNMTSDLNKGLTEIQYNVLNLPEKITHSTGSISQQVLYLTYGEVFLEKQRNTNDNLSPYRFNCKELNEEIMYIFIVIPCHHYFVNKEATIDSTVDNDGYVTKDGIIGGVKDKSNDLYITIDENIVL